MRKGKWGPCLLLSLAGIPLCLSCSGSQPFPPRTSSPPTPISSPDSSPALQFQQQTLPHSLVYTLQIPVGQAFVVTPAIAPTPQALATFAQQQQAIAVLNGGFFDPVNGQSTSYIVLGGKGVADPRSNSRLTDNPDLRPYLPKILNRSEFRRYTCQGTAQYAIARHDQPAPSQCETTDALGGGPRLLPDLTAMQEGFTAEADGILIRDAIGLNQRNARTAIGILRNGDLLWVMAAQKPDAPDDSGMTLPELAEFMRRQGAVEAVNLDGGSSSALYYNGRTIYGKIDSEGNPVQRPVKSVLILRPNTG